jgi:hypothetical protein
MKCRLRRHLPFGMASNELQRPSRDQGQTALYEVTGPRCRRPSIVSAPSGVAIKVERPIRASKDRSLFDTNLLLATGDDDAPPSGLLSPRCRAKRSDQHGRQQKSTKLHPSNSDYQCFFVLCEPLDVRTRLSPVH